MSRFEEFHGQAALPAAIGAVLDNPELDLTVVRGFIPDAGVRDTLTQEGGDPYHAMSALYEAAPSLQKADSLVARRWDMAGYVGTQVTRGVVLDLVRRSGILPHLDDLRFQDRTVEAMIQGSLALKGERLFSGEKLPERFLTAEGGLDVAAYKAFWGYRTPLYDEVNDGRRPRTEVTVEARDLALFAHHPQMTLHAVRHAEGTSSVARLLTWYAEK
jgi:hypothetical protein